MAPRRVGLVGGLFAFVGGGSAALGVMVLLLGLFVLGESVIAGLFLFLVGVPVLVFGALALYPAYHIKKHGPAREVAITGRVPGFIAAIPKRITN